MTTTINTTRFGTIEVNEEHLIHFKDGMIGFPTLKTYVLIESTSNPILLWLQSTQAAEIAFPVIEPWFFKAGYKANLSEADKASLDYAEGDMLKTFTVLTIPMEIAKMTVNLKAPVLINIEKATGTQVILQDKTLEVRTPAYDSFTHAVNSLGEKTSQQPSGTVEESFAAVEFKSRSQIETSASSR